MKNNFINVDGKETGYVALNEQGQIINFKSGTVFLNKNILNAVLERNNVTRFRYGLLVEGKLVPMSEIDETSEEFMTCRYITDDALNHVICNVKDRVISVGYFSFGWDPTERVEDREEGKKISKKNSKMVQDAISYLVRKGELSPRVKDYNGHSANRLPGTTIRIRTIKCCELVKINEFRKSIGLKCLPFDKDLDRWKSIYFIFTIDVNDPYNDKELNNKMIDVTLTNIDKYIYNNHFLLSKNDDECLSTNKIDIVNEILL